MLPPLAWNDGIGVLWGVCGMAILWYWFGESCSDWDDSLMAFWRFWKLTAVSWVRFPCMFPCCMYWFESAARMSSMFSKSTYKLSPFSSARVGPWIKSDLSTWKMSSSSMWKGPDLSLSPPAWLESAVVFIIGLTPSHISVPPPPAYDPPAWWNPNELLSL